MYQNCIYCSIYVIQGLYLVLRIGRHAGLWIEKWVKNRARRRCFCTQKNVMERRRDACAKVNFLDCTICVLVLSNYGTNQYSCQSLWTLHMNHILQLNWSFSPSQEFTVVIAAWVICLDIYLLIYCLFVYLYSTLIYLFIWWVESLSISGSDSSLRYSGWHHRDVRVSDSAREPERLLSFHYFSFLFISFYFFSQATEFQVIFIFVSFR